MKLRGGRRYTGHLHYSKVYAFGNCHENDFFNFIIIEALVSQIALSFLKLVHCPEHFARELKCYFNVKTNMSLSNLCTGTGQYNYF